MIVEAVMIFSFCSFNAPVSASEGWAVAYWMQANKARKQVRFFNGLDLGFAW
jgi:hypothetical protein